MIDAVEAALPAALRPVVRFAYITGWRVQSEVLPLEWRHVDRQKGEVRLEPGTTKNQAGRVFPFTDGLRTLIEAQWHEHERLKKRPRRSVPMSSAGTGGGSRRSGRRGPMPARPPVILANCCTTFAGRPFATWSGRVFRGPSPCS
jgi:integrase